MPACLPPVPACRRIPPPAPRRRRSLGCWRHDRRKANGTLRWTIEQGLEIGRPSIIEIEVDKADGDIVAVRVGGSAVMMSEGLMQIPGLNP